jgi:mono/diheme cytochrome c family protein
MIELEITNHKSQITILIFGIWGLFFLFNSCSTKSAKFQQYYAQGQVLYEKNCSNCHQKNGKGLGLLYPPLAESDYFEKNFNASLCLMKYGARGKIIVNGKEFNKPMPGVPSLTELEIAEIATYINNSWGRQNEMVEISQVTSVLNECELK